MADLLAFKRSTTATGGVVEFDPALHRYTINGDEAAGTSRLLKRNGIMKEVSWVDEGKMERGDRIHQAVALDIHGDYLDGLTAEESGWLEGARKFRREHALVEEDAEVLVGREDYMVATLIDHWGRLPGGQLRIDEWKTGDPDPWHRLQTGIQRLLCPTPPAAVWRVYLKADGTYRIVDDTRDVDALNTARALCMANGAASSWVKRAK